MNGNIKIGLIVADDGEYLPLAERIEKGEYTPYTALGRNGHSFCVKGESNTASVISLFCGIGKVNAAAAAMHMVDAGCNIIMNFGLSGGVSGVRRGDYCVPERFLEHDFDLTGIGYKPCEKPMQKYIYESDKALNSIISSRLGNVAGGTAVSGDRFVCSAEERLFLKVTFDAVSCDMETAAIAYVCDASGIPFVSLRRISDDAGDDAASCYREMNCSEGSSLADTALDCIAAVADTGFGGCANG